MLEEKRMDGNLPPVTDPDLRDLIAKLQDPTYPRTKKKVTNFLVATTIQQRFNLRQQWVTTHLSPPNVQRLGHQLQRRKPTALGLHS